jgi:hypothetical protein
MVEFTHYFIYGNPPEDFTREKMEEWSSTVPKKFNMELVYFGVSIGTAEDLLVVLNGKVTDFEKLYTQEYGPPLIDRRTTFGGTWS